ncbi:MAG TPA: sensor histidine kinase [Steroidobacteraceae bacterium]
MDQLAQRGRFLRYASAAMIVAAGLRAAYTAWTEPGQLAQTGHWAAEWCAAYVVFIATYALMPTQGSMRMTRRQAWLVAAQTLSGLALVWLYPSFIVSCLMVIVAWQCALLLDFRAALAITLGQIVALALVSCKVESQASWFLVLVSCAGFQLFAFCAAQLARSEIAARDELARANMELRATQAILDESARTAERLRIARDLHDVMGHTLTTLTIQLDVVSKLTSGPAAEHVACARSAASELLDQVRSVVSRFRIQPADLKAALEKLAEDARGLRVQLRVAPELTVSDPARAEAIVRCVQEVITNALRHSRGSELVIDLTSGPDAILISAHDDGKGGDFVPGHGLAGMRERFEALGGSLSVSSASGTGFTIQAALPLPGSAL